MSTFLLVLIILVAILLILVVLIQNPKGGGIATGFGGSNLTQFMGVKKTGDILERTTWILSGLLFLLCLSIGMTTNTSSTPKIEDSETIQQNIESATKNETPLQPANNNPSELNSVEENKTEQK
ncbi:MAG: preprotein translocase subunit SecG [Cytophagaceae bacterium]|nr:preprotein translocase subunit SecG [Cytophagaceae bacterium]MDW8456428.1 preprotein translocase subunit SecG [Cytophagaceae bacterium]